MEGWLLVSCSCSSSSMQEELKAESAGGAAGGNWLQEEEGVRNNRRTRGPRTGERYLYMCRLSGPSRLQEDGPDAAGSEVTASRLNG